MISSISLYEDVSNRISQSENGNFSYKKFNQISWLAQLSLIDWLSGSLDGVTPPEPYLSQKNIDWLSPFVTIKPDHVIDGKIKKPSDYYLFDSITHYVGSEIINDDCGEETLIDIKKKSITLLEGQTFNQRVKTHIKLLKPENSPICKVVGDSFFFEPANIGSVELCYIRYPKRAEIKTIVDTVYNREVPNPATSIDFEWDEYARNPLVWFIVDEWSNNTREQASKAFNKMTGKTTREAGK